MEIIFSLFDYVHKIVNRNSKERNLFYEEKPVLSKDILMNATQNLPQSVK